MSKYKQGVFNPQNPEKWILAKTSITQGNAIRYMSSYELKCFKFLDTHPSIIKVSSEPFAIPYLSPKDDKIHRYYPDLIVKNKDGTIFLVEIKPHSQTIPPKIPKTNRKSSLERYARELETYNINIAKWQSAAKFCNEKNIKFLILTEKHLNIK